MILLTSNFVETKLGRSKRNYRSKKMWKNSHLFCLFTSMERNSSLTSYMYGNSSFPSHKRFRYTHATMALNFSAGFHQNQKTRTRYSPYGLCKTESQSLCKTFENLELKITICNCGKWINSNLMSTRIVYIPPYHPIKSTSLVSQKMYSPSRLEILPNWRKGSG